jgi:hypothetical protein
MRFLGLEIKLRSGKDYIISGRSRLKKTSGYKISVALNIEFSLRKNAL